MEVPRALLEQFMAFTNCDEAVARQQLRSNALDVEAAIANYFAIIEAGGNVAETVRNDGNNNSSGEQASEDDSVEEVPESISDDEVEVISEQNNNEGLGNLRNFVQDLRRQGDRSSRGSVPPGMNEANRFFFDTDDSRNPESWGDVARSIMNDHSRSARRHRSMLSSSPPEFSSSPGSFAPFSSRGRTGGNSSAFDRMFRKPTEIMYHGSWDAALSEGTTSKKWILINVQDETDFTSMCLNRDIWNDEGVQQLIRANFLFLQRRDGDRVASVYRQFYPFEQIPHVAVVDPRSGERLAVWGDDGDITKDKLVDALVTFVDSHSLDDTRPAPHRRTPVANTANHTNHDQDLQEAEEAQMAAVIAASLEDANGSEDDSPLARSPADEARRASNIASASNEQLNEHRSIRAQQDSEYHESLALDRAKAETERIEAMRQQQEAERRRKEEEEMKADREAKLKRLPTAPNANSTKPITEIAIRLPDGKRLQRKFYAHDTIGDVYDYVEVEIEERKAGSYELMTAFPRKAFTDRSLTLKDADLCPKAALVIHEL